MKKTALFIILAVACNLFLADDNKLPAKRKPAKPKKSMAAQNRADLWRELETCYTSEQIQTLLTLLELCVEDFHDADELDRITEAAKLRAELINLVDVTLEGVPPKFIDMIDRYERANFDGLHILQLYCKRHRAAFNDQEWEDLETRYFLQIEKFMTVTITGQPE